MWKSKQKLWKSKTSSDPTAKVYTQLNWKIWIKWTTLPGAKIKTESSKESHNPQGNEAVMISLPTKKKKKKKKKNLKDKLFICRNI